MNKTFLTITLTILIVAGASSAAFMAQPASVSPAATLAQPSQPLVVPAGLVVPEQLPDSLDDPAVLAAWIELYHQTEPIPLWDGHDVTGRELALFLLEEHIPVVWDVDRICGGSSCSLRHYTPFGWVHDDGVPGVDPIYIRPSAQGDSSGLLMILAHEIFHRTEPFGSVGDTRFEEYWAFQVGNAVSPAEWPVFEGYDPLSPRDLFHWVRDNNIGAYYRLPSYPTSIERRLVEAA